VAGIGGPEILLGSSPAYLQAYQQVNYPQMLRESLWIFVDICGYLWIFVDICGYRWGYMWTTGRYAWIFVDLCGSLWIFVDLCGSLWIFVDLCGSLWIFVDIQCPSDSQKLGGREGEARWPRDIA
jgi:hypothetical protein